MSDDVIRGIILEKKRKARIRRKVLETAILSIFYSAFGLMVVAAIAAS